MVGKDIDDPSRGESSKFEFELLQARERRKVWQPRFEQFQSEWTHRISRGGDSPDIGYEIKFRGPHYEWMRPDNLGEYLLFRLDAIDRAGGTDQEKSWRQEPIPRIGLDNRKRAVFEAGGPTLFGLTERGGFKLYARLSSLDNEAYCWGDQSYNDFHHVTRKLSPIGNPAPLTPQQTSLLKTLWTRAVLYDSPQWRRWSRKATERAPTPRPGAPGVGPGTPPGAR